MDGYTVLFCAWLFILTAFLFLYIKTGSATKWNNCAVILAPLLPSLLFMPFAAAIGIYVHDKAAVAAFYALCLCAAVLPFLLFFLVNRHIARKGEGRLAPLCLPLVFLLVPLCVIGVRYFASLCLLGIFGYPAWF